jgi:hypothetical protein
MPATYVTEAELRSALGIGALYSSVTVEDVCQAAENIVKAKLNFNRQVAIARSNEAGVGKLYFQYEHSFYVSQTITVENCGQHFNGSKTITETSEYTVSFSTSHLTTIPKQDLVPYGYAYDGEFTDFSTLDEVRQASLMIAVDIWQARQTSNAGGISPDFQPSPYRMGNTLMARVRGLLAEHLAPGGQVG